MTSEAFDNDRWEAERKARLERVGHKETEMIKAEPSEKGGVLTLKADGTIGVSGWIFDVSNGPYSARTVVAACLAAIKAASDADEDAANDEAITGSGNLDFMTDGGWVERSE